MIIKLHIDTCTEDQHCWFMQLPMDSPSYVSTARATEAVERVLNGETGWKISEISWKRLMGPRR